MVRYDLSAAPKPVGDVSNRFVRVVGTGVVLFAVLFLAYLVSSGFLSASGILAAARYLYIFVLGLLLGVGCIIFQVTKPGAAYVDVNDDSLTFGFPNGSSWRLEWSDVRFKLDVTRLSVIGRMIRLAQPRPVVFVTGRHYIRSYLTESAWSAIRVQAKAHGLGIDDRPFGYEGNTATLITR